MDEKITEDKRKRSGARSVLARRGWHYVTLDATDAITQTFGEYKPQVVSYPNGWLDLVYYQNPGLKAGKTFPLWTIR
jgi:hypothetical protein